MNHDARCREAIARSINLTVPWYLMAAYAYYQKDDPILSDCLFDEMARLMLSRYEEIEHPHKYLIRKDDLEAGTLLLLPGQDYPSIAKSAAERLIQDLHPQPKRRKRQ